MTQTLGRVDNPVCNLFILSKMYLIIVLVSYQIVHTDFHVGHVLYTIMIRCRCIGVYIILSVDFSHAFNCILKYIGFQSMHNIPSSLANMIVRCCLMKMWGSWCNILFVIINIVAPAIWRRYSWGTSGGKTNLYPRKYPAYCWWVGCNYMAVSLKIHLSTFRCELRPFARSANGQWVNNQVFLLYITKCKTLILWILTFKLSCKLMDCPTLWHHCSWLQLMEKLQMSKLQIDGAQGV